MPVTQAHKADKAQIAETALRSAKTAVMAAGRDAAILALRDVARSYPGTSAGMKAYSMLASQYSSSGEKQKERQVWMEAAAANGKSPCGEEAVRGLGRIYLAAKENDTGTAQLRALGKRYPGTQLAAGAALGVGRLAEAKGNIGNAVDAYQEAVRVSPDSVSATDAVDAIRSALLGSGKQDKALAVLQDIMQAYPKKEAGRAAEYCAGLVYVKQAKFELAERSFQSVIDGSPKCRSASAARASLLATFWDQSTSLNGAHQQETAIALFRKILRYETRSEMIGEAHCMICINLLSKGSYQDVHDAFKSASAHPASSEFGFWQGVMATADAMAYYNAHDYQHALPAIRELASKATSDESRRSYDALIDSMEKDLHDSSEPGQGIRLGPK